MFTMAIWRGTAVHGGVGLVVGGVGSCLRQILLLTVRYKISRLHYQSNLRLACPIHETPFFFLVRWKSRVNSFSAELQI
jgi:hypothetical protein